MDKIILGSEEYFSFPELNIPVIKARIDSGAKTSAIHALNISPFKKGDENWVKFDINPIQNDLKTIISCEAKVIDKRIVKSSSGYREHRFVIQTEIFINNEKWLIELTLTNRDSMGYRMLLGREAMMGRVLVDPEKSFVLGEPPIEVIKDTYKNNQRQSTGLRIGLLASNPELYSNIRIMELVKLEVMTCIF